MSVVEDRINTSSVDVGVFFPGSGAAGCAGDRRSCLSRAISLTRYMASTECPPRSLFLLGNLMVSHLVKRNRLLCGIKVNIEMMLLPQSWKII